MKGWIRLHVANLCNFRCPHCHVFQGSENNQPAKIMPRAEIELALEKYLDVTSGHGFDEVSVSFYGGEPLLAKKQIFPVMQKWGSLAKGLRLNWIFNSNGSLLTDGDIEFFKYFPLLEFHLSIDGPENVQIKSRPDKAGGNSYESALSALQRLNKHNIRTQINSYIMPENSAHLEHLVDLCVQHKVENLYLDVMHFPEHPMTNSTIQRMEEILLYASSKNVRLHGPWSTINFDGWNEDHIERKILGVEILQKGIYFRTVDPLSKMNPWPVAQMDLHLSADGIRQYRKK